MQLNSKDIVAFREKILKWYDRHKRDLPWRAKDGEIKDPYKIWLSEVMLQQTTVQAVKPYFLRFTELWPTIFDLASANSDDLMQEWAGLGYYARARNLHACAKTIVSKYDGVFPQNIDELRKLSGIGDYTSAAIAAIAFDKPANVVDGNVERVMARYFNIQTYMPEAKAELKAFAGVLSENIDFRTGDYAQALMDLGATICTPKSPLCSLCPVNAGCAGYRSGNPSLLPLKKKKGKNPQRAGFVYLIKNQNGEILLQKRGDKGLLGGMIGLPTSDWSGIEGKIVHPDIIKDNPVEDLNLKIHHVFTHFDLTLYLHSLNVQKNITLKEGHFWVSQIEFSDMRFPTVFGKAKKIFMKHNLF